MDDEQEPQAESSGLTYTHDPVTWGHAMKMIIYSFVLTPLFFLGVYVLYHVLLGIFKFINYVLS